MNSPEPIERSPLPGPQRQRIAGIGGSGLKFSFSIGSVFIITVVVAFIAVCAAQFYRSVATGDARQVGWFAILAAVAPSGILIVAGTMFKIIRFLAGGARNPAPNDPLDLTDPFAIDDRLNPDE